MKITIALVALLSLTACGQFSPMQGIAAHQGDNQNQPDRKPLDRAQVKFVGDMAYRILVR